MRMCKQQQLHCTSQWGWQMPLSEHVYCVAIAFKMPEQVEQQICIKFCIKLRHSSSETIWMMQKATATSNWWLAASSWQQHTQASWLLQSFGRTSNHPGDSALYSPDLVPCNFWLFSKLKSPLKGKWFQTMDEIHENTTGQLWELCEVPRCCFWGVNVLCTMFVVSSSISVSIFIAHGWILSGQTSNKVQIEKGVSDSCHQRHTHHQT